MKRELTNKGCQYLYKNFFLKRRLGGIRTDSFIILLNQIY
ncbi:Uncharacterized protein dnm_084690 [Desulfonema magnum]|uniref:Uncharacterized protein n=1 Tax=Desulfonema magnum TaxID=45655 RepID=A0A975BV50_9BACT|nr:Uncharacterized protein dnm_084690 [Desulfonema magnum]